MFTKIINNVRYSITSSKYDCGSANSIQTNVRTDIEQGKRQSIGLMHKGETVRYTISETFTPEGYYTMDDFYMDVTYNKNGVITEIVLEDGTKLNKSSKFNETKNIDGIEISNIQFTYKDGQTVLLADVINNSGKAVDMTLLDIKLLDEQGNEIITVGGIISPMQVGETSQLNASMTMDYANAYDVEITLKK